jgi:uncharacterized protein YbjT (DUF2867 family)
MGAEARDRLSLHRIERRLTSTGVAWTILRPNIYMQNFARGFVARGIRESGTFRLSAGDGRVSFVDVRDVAEIAAHVLSREDDFDKAYTLSGPSALSHAQVAQAIAAVTKKPVRYEPVDEKVMYGQLQEAGWSAAQADTFVALLRAIREGERATVTDDATRLLGRPATSFDVFARDHVSAWK